MYKGSTAPRRTGQRVLLLHFIIVFVTQVISKKYTVVLWNCNLYYTSIRMEILSVNVKELCVVEFLVNYVLLIYILCVNISLDLRLFDYISNIIYIFELT